MRGACMQRGTVFAAPPAPMYSRSADPYPRFTAVMRAFERFPDIPSDDEREQLYAAIRDMVDELKLVGWPSDRIIRAVQAAASLGSPRLTPGVAALCVSQATRRYYGDA